jgi:hypothetical protein
MTDTTPLTPFLSAAALHGELEDWGPLAEATGDAMQTSGVTTWAHGDLEVVGPQLLLLGFLLEAGDQRGHPSSAAG